MEILLKSKKNTSSTVQWLLKSNKNTSIKKQGNDFNEINQMNKRADLKNLWQQLNFEKVKKAKVKIGPLKIIAADLTKRPISKLAFLM